MKMHITGIDSSNLDHLKKSKGEHQNDLLPTP